MIDSLKPLRAESLKDIFINRFERMILSGEIQLGRKLPSERDLAARLGVSRPVVHEGLLELAGKGLVTMKPRAGAVVNDFRRQGSLPLISSLLEYGEGRLDHRLLESILELRIILETPFARLAAMNRTEDQLAELYGLIERERAMVDPANKSDIVALDFEFHLLIALATGNLIFPLLMNSCKPVYTNLTGQFFDDPAVIRAVYRFHEELVAAIADGDPDRAASVMGKMLEHGEQRLRIMLDSDNLNDGLQRQSRSLP